MKTLRLVLGDQLNSQHSWYKQVDDNVVYVLMEMRQETDYAYHHVQKVIAFFLAMRHFTDELRSQGHRVIYYTLDDPANTQRLTDNVDQLIREHQIDKFEYLQPDEYRLDQLMNNYCRTLSIPSQAYDTEHFFTTRDELRSYYGRRNYVMEFFYRYLRQKHNILMDGNDPVTGRWNYDDQNRNPLPKDLSIVPPRLYKREVTEVYDMLVRHGVRMMGTVDLQHFIWPVTRAEFLEMIQFFNRECLPYFGAYQDAMAPEAWSLYHSRLSFGMNSKLISPKEVVYAAVAYYLDNQDKIGYAQIEGFVRQILGWREFMRGVYWAKMPEFAQLNFFNHTRPLPAWYWDGQTRANCLKHAIGHSLQYAYSHHIQRLMITGNFALLLGVNPDEVDAWYLGVYIDAIEWVEITNTRGMSQHADGGIVGTKPYVSTATYINRMSSYCKGCYYDKSKKVGERACPFNSLYWDFFDRHRDKLAQNPRIEMMYRTWDRMKPDEKEAILRQADYYANHANEI